MENGIFGCRYEINTWYLIIIIFYKSSSEGIGNADYKKATSIYDFTVPDIDGNNVSLEKYRWVESSRVG